MTRIVWHARANYVKALPQTTSTDAGGSWGRRRKARKVRHSLIAFPGVASAPPIGIVPGPSRQIYIFLCNLRPSRPGYRSELRTCRSVRKKCRQLRFRGEERQEKALPAGNELSVAPLSPVLLLSDPESLESFRARLRGCDPRQTGLFAAQKLKTDGKTLSFSRSVQNCSRKGISIRL